MGKGFFFTEFICVAMNVKQLGCTSDFFNAGWVSEIAVVKWSGNKTSLMVQSTWEDRCQLYALMGKYSKDTKEIIQFQECKHY